MSTPNSILTLDGKSDQLVKEVGLDIAAHNNLVGSSHATISAGGALQEDVSNLTSNVSKHNKSIKEHGLNIVAYENPVRSNDGTSTGALSADRLRMARPRVLESMMLKRSPDSKVDQPDSVPVHSKRNGF
ncbi:hypothetical protein HJC23_014090 [Cyclotella cryptica]|uniref:Uncharacterized protein n=1 Tax=Cyclotella cryptica TaxID=29204 RepID=A0ABD3QTR5_9STRA